jgi:hypothetical protein
MANFAFPLVFLHFHPFSIVLNLYFEVLYLLSRTTAPSYTHYES